MGRGLRWVVAIAAVAAAAGDARAQFGFDYYPVGYGGFGWGGWGATVQGDIARGLGDFAAGAGVYNRDTAVANSINTDTALRWNEYWYESQIVANRNERLRMDARMRRDAAAGELAYKRVLEDPTPDDIASGDALNAALDQVSNPRVHSSALRLMTNRIPGKVVRDLPFVNASDAVSINLAQLTGEDGWPSAFKNPRLDEERRAYSRAIEEALAEDRQGDLSGATIARVRDALARLRAKFEANRPADVTAYNEGLNYLKSLYGMTRMLERPEVEKIIAELESAKETTLGSLLGFMHTFNLRFGRATTPTQRAAYEQLFPLLDAHRDRIVRETRTDDKASARATDTPPPPRRNDATDFFQGMHLDHLEGKRKVN
jgi:hypothetical protein